MTIPANPDRSALLDEAAKALIAILGEQLAVGIAAKCKVRFVDHPIDHECAQLAEAIIRLIGPDRFEELDVL